MLTSLLEELNEKFNASLDTNIMTSRDPSYLAMEDLVDHDNFIVVGSSHAYRLANALKEAGETVNCLASPFWRLTEENVTNTSAALTEAVANNPHATVVLQLYDSSIYFASSETGELTLPKHG